METTAIQTQKQTESREHLQLRLENSLKQVYIQLSEKEIDLIRALFKKLILSRNENVTDYNIEVMISILKEKNYAFNQTREMIELAFELPKFNKFAIGDLIENWKKNNSETPINYSEFNKALSKVLEYDKEILNRISQAINGTDFITADEKQKYLQFLKDKIEDYYTQKNLKELESQLKEYDILTDIKKIDEALKIKNEFYKTKLENLILKSDNIFFKKLLQKEINGI